MRRQSERCHRSVTHATSPPAPRKNPLGALLTVRLDALLAALPGRHGLEAHRLRRAQHLRQERFPRIRRRKGRLSFNGYRAHEQSVLFLLLLLLLIVVALTLSEIFGIFFRCSGTFLEHACQRPSSPITCTAISSIQLSPPSPVHGVTPLSFASPLPLHLLRTDPGILALLRRRVPA